MLRLEGRSSGAATGPDGKAAVRCWTVGKVSSRPLTVMEILRTPGVLMYVRDIQLPVRFLSQVPPLVSVPEGKPRQL